MSKRLCLFCDSTSLTLEHIPHGKERSQQQWAQDTITLKARIVCGSCNNGWMSDIEESASHILRPLITKPYKHYLLSPEARLHLSNWITLHAMTFDRARGLDESYYSSDELRSFASASSPLSRSHIWLAMFPPAYAKGIGAHIYSRVSNNKTIGFKVFSCFMGQAAFQSFHWKGFFGGNLRNDSTGAVISLDKLSSSAWRNLTSDIWPISKSTVKWPCREALTHQGVNALMARFVI
jgi:hypothetical protein